MDWAYRIPVDPFSKTLTPFPPLPLRCVPPHACCLLRLLRSPPLLLPATPAVCLHCCGPTLRHYDSRSPPPCSPTLCRCDLGQCRHPSLILVAPAVLSASIPCGYRHPPLFPTAPTVCLQCRGPHPVPLSGPTQLLSFPIYVVVGLLSVCRGPTFRLSWPCPRPVAPARPMPVVWLFRLLFHVC